MEREKGLEPSTYAMATRRSSQLSYSRPRHPIQNNVESGDDNRYGLLLILSRNVVKKVLEKLNIFRGATPFSPSDGSSSQSGDSRPITQYNLVEDPQKTLNLFRRLKDSLMAMNEATRRRGGGTTELRFEWGHLPEGREFFYLQPWNEEGLLFEQAHKGWLISRAHKIPQSSQFMRQSVTWDVVTVFEPDNDGMLRLSSSRFSDDLLSFPLYEEALLDQLPLGKAP